MVAQATVGQRATGDDLSDDTAAEQNEDHGADELGCEFTDQTCLRCGFRHGAIVGGADAGGIRRRTARVNRRLAPGALEVELAAQASGTSPHRPAVTSSDNGRWLWSRTR
ncbi:hypothetical protein GCM10022232_87520 [Streptomyces plumbiresistens]|uniref:Uncharacterized protein n=1 Tax=Streptomyces plumbiresistens TaxID=511811 RepID=A0ABP7TLN1_9ACTN